MTDQPEPTPEDPKTANRRKWFGRVLLILFGLLLLAQVIPLLLRSGELG